MLFLAQCTFLLPPITVTGAKTAAEKQIIGDQTELERDVWMISSAKTTSEVTIQTDSKDTTLKTVDENSKTYKGFAILDTFNPEMLELKKDGVAGENNNGLLSNLLLEKNIEIAPETQQKYAPDNGNFSKILLETIKQINLARNYIVEGYIINQKMINPEFNPDKNELLKSQKGRYQGSSLKGEYIQLDDGSWIKKK